MSHIYLFFFIFIWVTFFYFIFIWVTFFFFLYESHLFYFYMSHIFILFYFYFFYISHIFFLLFCFSFREKVGLKVSFSYIFVLVSGKRLGWRLSAPFRGRTRLLPTLRWTSCAPSCSPCTTTLTSSRSSSTKPASCTRRNSRRSSWKHSSCTWSVFWHWRHSLTNCVPPLIMPRKYIYK